MRVNGSAKRRHNSWVGWKGFCVANQFPGQFHPSTNCTLQLLWLKSAPFSADCCRSCLPSMDSLPRELVIPGAVVYRYCFDCRKSFFRLDTTRCGHCHGDQIYTATAAPPPPPLPPPPPTNLCTESRLAWKSVPLTQLHFSPSHVVDLHLCVRASFWRGCTAARDGWGSIGPYSKHSQYGFGSYVPFFDNPMRAQLAFEEYEDQINTQDAPVDTSTDELLHIRFLIPQSEMISWVTDQSIVRRLARASSTQDEYMYWAYNGPQPIRIDEWTVYVSAQNTPNEGSLFVVM